MKRHATIILALLCSTLLFGLHAAQAACVMPAGLPANDVSLDGFAFEVASLTTPAVEVDMNGVQRGVEDQRSWATHGTLVVLLRDPTGAPPELIASWTKNTFFETEEWVCRMRLDGTTAFGEGVVHTLTPDAKTFSTLQIRECKMDLVADCP